MEVIAIIKREKYWGPLTPLISSDKFRNHFSVLTHGKCHPPFSSASICSWVKDVRFLCSFLFSWSLIWASSESSPFELIELVFSPPPSCCVQPSAMQRRGHSKYHSPRQMNMLSQTKLAIVQDTYNNEGISVLSTTCILIHIATKAKYLD